MVAELCILGLVACDEGGPGLVNASVRTVTSAGHRHARVGANNTSEKMEQTGTWVHQVARAMEEQLREDEHELKTLENKQKAKDAKRIRRIVHELKGTSHVQSEMRKLMHHDEQELFSLCEVWHWDDNKGGWLDPELCTKARRE